MDALSLQSGTLSPGPALPSLRHGRVGGNFRDGPGKRSRLVLPFQGDYDEEPGVSPCGGLSSRGATGLLGRVLFSSFCRKLPFVSPTGTGNPEPRTKVFSSFRQKPPLSPTAGKGVPGHGLLHFPSLVPISEHQWFFRKRRSLDSPRGGLSSRGATGLLGAELFSSFCQKPPFVPQPGTGNPEQGTAVISSFCQKPPFVPSQEPGTQNQEPMKTLAPPAILAIQGGQSIL